MLDQDTARALLTVADECRVRVALLGDRHQLAAVGRGGVLDLAVAQVDAGRPPDPGRACTASPAPTPTAARVPDTEYADLTLAMRAGDDPGAVFDALLARGQIRLHPDPDALRHALAEIAAAAYADGEPVAVVADTREQVAELNAAIRDRLVAAGRVDDAARSRSPGRGSGSASGTGSPPAATTATSTWPTATPGPSPPSAATAGCSSPPPTAPGRSRCRRRRRSRDCHPGRSGAAGAARRLRHRARGAGLRQHRARRAGRHRHRRAPGDRRAHRRRVGLRRDDPRPGSPTPRTSSPPTPTRRGSSGSRSSPATGPTSAPPTPPGRPRPRPPATPRPGRWSRCSPSWQRRGRPSSAACSASPC